MNNNKEYQTIDYDIYQVRFSNSIDKRTYVNIKANTEEECWEQICKLHKKHVLYLSFDQDYDYYLPQTSVLKYSSNGKDIIYNPFPEINGYKRSIQTIKIIKLIVIYEQ